jgi:hypothetical protein
MTGLRLYVILAWICVCLAPFTSSSQRYENFYQATNANLLEVRTNSQVEHLLKGATVLLPNSSKQLDLRLQVPPGIFFPMIADDSLILNQPFFLDLKIDIDRDRIQEYLTSSRIFTTHGNLVLNNRSQTVEVSYLPMPSGTNEDGSFNIFITVSFNPTDFNLANEKGNLKYVLKVNDAFVNRI